MKCCDYCCRSVKKYQRKYKGKGYCSTCYAREFKSRPCSKCGEIKRLPKNLDYALCTECQKCKPCFRCGKTDYPVGKITKYGAVCNACAFYFRKKESCENCGELSFSLLRPNQSNESKRLCVRCYRKAKGFRSCPQCRKYRIMIETGSGLMCKKCATKGTSCCEKCHVEISAGKGKVCDSCYWYGNLKHSLTFLQVKVKGDVWRSEFSAYAEWLAKNTTNKNAALSIQRQTPFFIEASYQWETIPSYETILTYFRTKGLRKYKKIDEWLLSVNQVIDSLAEIKQRVAEEDRISVLLQKISSNTLSSAIIQGYHEVMILRHASGETSLKSVRLALQPAVGLLQNLNGIPEQPDINNYLKTKSGQRAAVTGFVNFINHQYNRKLTTKLTEIKSSKQEKQELEREVIRFVKECHNNPSSFNEGQWLKIAFPYFHQHIFKGSSRIEYKEDCLIVHQESYLYHIPLP